MYSVDQEEQPAKALILDSFAVVPTIRRQHPSSKQIVSAIAMLHTQTLEGSWNEDNSILSVTAFFLEGRALAKERLIGLSWSVCRVRLE